MKIFLKFLPYAGILLFPYLIVFSLFCVFTGFLMDTVFNNNIIYLLMLIAGFFVIALMSALIVFFRGFSAKGMKKSLDVLRTNWIIKLIHIPAYLLIFVLGLLCTMTIFTIGITLVLMLLDGMTIMLSGLVGLGGIVGSLKADKIPVKRAVIHGILQFVYCIDIVSSILLYRTVKRTHRETVTVLE